MADLLWPGDERAGEAFSPTAVLAAMVAVEQAWLDALVAAGTAPASAGADLADLVVDVDEVAAAAESSGAPVVPLLDALRPQLGEDAAAWLHRGLTTQDVVDTALVLCARTAAGTICQDLERVRAGIERLEASYGATPMVGRTLTQHALPITFGHKLAQWRRGAEDALASLQTLRFPAQLGGPVGLGLPEAAHAAAALGLLDVPPWHTVRTPFTRYADALVAATDALGHLAGDVLVLARTEVGEVEEPAGRGGSSSMPHKQNPVLSVLVRRAALTTPGLAAQVHLAAADTHDERPDGAWHTEWSVLATLSRRALTAASQAAELVEGLQVHPDRMAANLEAR